MQAVEPKSNIEWRAWGREDPLFGVATCPGKNRNGPAPWTDDGFYRLGESDWKDFYLRWQRYGLETDSCVEIGCGAGRITRQLAKVFGKVHALDVSADMLAYARHNVPAGNVRFYPTSGADIPLPDGTVSAVFSCHVFQHFDSLELARHYFAEITRVLRVSGTAMIHHPVYDWPALPGFFGAVYQCRRRIEDLKTALNRRLINRGVFRPVMRQLTYPISWFYSELPGLGFRDIELCVFQVASSKDPHPCLLARKCCPGSSAISDSRLDTTSWLEAEPEKLARSQTRSFGQAVSLRTRDASY